MERLPDLGALQTHQWNYLQEQMSRLVQAWQEGDPGELEQFLPAPDDVLRAITLQELIITDLEMRWRNRQHVSLDYYVGKYPELGRLDDLPTKLIYEEFRIRQRHGDLPHLLSYRRRFPRQFSELEVLLEQQPPPTPVKEPPLAPTNTFSGSGTMPNQNATVNGYKFLRRLASGAFADVYEAEAPGGIRVALKVIRQALTNEDAKREYEALEVFKVLSHSCLLQVHGIWIHQEQLYVAMDLADCTLRDRLQDFKDAGAREGGIPGIPPRELLGYFRDAAEALDYLHSENVLHRDVKPANILLFKAKRVRAAKPGAVEGFQARAKLADFGLAKLVESQRLDASGGGTLAYMAPEACRNRTNPQSDLYSLAASYAELRLGRPLFPYTNLYDLTRAHLEETPDLAPLPIGEQKVLLRALAKDPEDRFPTCQQFTSALEEVLPLPPRPSSATSHSVAGYRLARLIGGGVRGESWEAVAPDGTHVALTVIRNLPWAQAVEECRTLQFLRGIQHPNLTRLHDAFLLGEQNTVLTLDTPPPSGSATVSLGIVRELLPENLGQRLDRCEKGIPTRELIGYLWQAAEGLDALRGPYPVEPAAPSPAPTPAEPEQASRWSWVRKRQPGPVPEAAPETVTLVHAAVSPRTLFADGPTIKVGDFALVKLLHSTQGLLPGDETLLPGYVPPELYHKQAHANSDQYSLAITYVELRTGRPPFKSTAPASLMAEQKEGKLNLKRLPDAERDVLKRATALDPAERYPSCREMVAALEEACFTSGIRGPAHPPAAEEKHPAAPPTFARPAAAAPAVTLSPEDSGEFVLRPAEPFPAALATASHSLPLNLEETIGKADLVAGPAGDAIQETRTGPELPVLPPPTVKPESHARAEDTAAKARPETDKAALPGKQPPKKSLDRKRSSRSLAAKLGLTGAALAFVALVACLAYWSGIFPPDPHATHVPPTSNKPGPGSPPPISLDPPVVANLLQKADALLDQDHTKALELYSDAEKAAEGSSGEQALRDRIRLGKARALARAGRWVEVERELKDPLRFPKELRPLANALHVRATTDKTRPETVLDQLTELRKTAVKDANWERAELDREGTRVSKEQTRRLAGLPHGDEALRLAQCLTDYDSANKAASAHKEALAAITRLRGTPAQVPEKGASEWLRELKDDHNRLAEICQAAADLAETNSRRLTDVSRFLTEAKDTLPDTLKPYVAYAEARVLEVRPNLLDAATRLGQVLQVGGKPPRFLETPKRQEWAANLLLGGAEAYRTDSILNPYQVPANAQQAYVWLQHAQQLRPEIKTKDSFRIAWVMAAWHRAADSKELKPAELDQVRGASNELLKKERSAAVNLELGRKGPGLLLLHAQVHAAADPSSAVRSYAELVRSLPADQVKDANFQKAVVERALNAVELIKADAKDSPGTDMASLHEVRAKFLETVEPRKKALEHYDKAARLDKSTLRRTERIEAHLRLAAEEVPDEVRQEAEGLISQDGKKPLYRRLLVQILRNQAGNTPDEAAKLALLTQLRKRCDEGLDVCRPDPKEVALVQECVAWEATSRNALSVPVYIWINKAGKHDDAIKWAENARDADPVMAARVKGTAYSKLRQWKKAREACEIVLDRATRKGDLWHLGLMAEYLDLLTRRDIPEAEKPSPADLTSLADRLLGLLDPPAHGLPKPPRIYQGWANGIAGVAWRHAAAQLKGKEKQQGSLKAIELLEKAFEQHPTFFQSGPWYLNYGDAMWDLFASEKTQKNLEACQRAAERLEKALPSKQAAWSKGVLPAERDAFEKELKQLIQELRSLKLK